MAQRGSREPPPPTDQRRLLGKLATTLPTSNTLDVEPDGLGERSSFIGRRRPNRAELRRSEALHRTRTCRYRHAATLHADRPPSRITSRLALTAWVGKDVVDAQLPQIAVDTTPYLFLVRIARAARNSRAAPER
jgi:hypothetical protein